MKTHLELIISRPNLTITTTLCRRTANSHFEINSTDKPEEVTCKFCLNILKRKEAA